MQLETGNSGIFLHCLISAVPFFNLNDVHRLVYPWEKPGNPSTEVRRPVGLSWRVRQNFPHRGLNFEIFSPLLVFILTTLFRPTANRFTYDISYFTDVCNGIHFLKREQNLPETHYGYKNIHILQITNYRHKLELSVCMCYFGNIYRSPI